MPTEPSVTEKGIPISQDLGNAETTYTSDNLNSLDKAMEDAGLFVEDKTTTPADPAPTDAPPADAPPADPAPTDAPPADPVPSDAPPTDAPPADPAPTDAPPADPTPASDAGGKPKLTAKEIEALDLDAEPDGISPRNRVNFDNLRTATKFYKEQAQKAVELEKKLTKMEADAVANSATAEELNELRRFKLTHDAQNDPSITKEFDDKLGILSEEILGILAENGAPPASIETLKKYDMARIPSEWWEENVLSKLPLLARQRIERRLVDNVEISGQRAKKIQDVQANGAKYQEERAQRFAKEAEDFKKVALTHLDQITEKIPWARYKEASATATEEERNAVAKHNEGVEELHQHFNEALNPPTAQARVEVAAAAAASVRLSRVVTDLSERLRGANERYEKLQKEMDNIRAAGKLPSSRPTNKDRSFDAPSSGNVSDEDAIEAGLQIAESSL